MLDDDAATADAVRAIEAIVMVAPEPVEPQLLAQLLELPVTTITALCERLAEAYETAGHGFQLVRVAGGYRFQSHPDLAPYVERFVLEGQSARLSAAALETLAVIAYKQPVTLPEIIDLRGVKSGGVIKTLLEKRLIRITGRKEVVGRPMLYGTTREFLLHFGLKDVGDLPRIEEFAAVLGEDVDVDGLRRAIDAPRPAEVPLAEAEPHVEGAAEDLK
jgi:segregation and condensation protein B